MASAEELARIRLLAKSGRARKIRERARLSQSEIAAEIETAPATVSRWESGDRVPTGRAAIRYLRLLERLGDICGRGGAR